MSSQKYNPPSQSKGPFEPVQDDSPDEEVALVKRKYTKRHLCKAWVDVSENGVEGYARKAFGPRPKVTQFYAVYNTVKQRHQSGANDQIYIRLLACKECRAIYGGSKKSRISKTTSHDTSDLAHIGLDLYDEAANYEDLEVQEVRPMGQDMYKKKSSPSSTARLESSTAGEAEAGNGTGKSEAWGGSELKKLKLAQEERM
ncbi:hypothetical protein Tco_0713966 [Tanacetum coccineum]